jgi:hypothetical protein
MRTIVACLALSVLCTIPTPAFAQTRRPYAGASIGSFDVSADHVDGKSTSAGLLAGMAVSRLVDLELELQFPTTTVKESHSGILFSFAPQGASRAEIERLGVRMQIDRHRDVIASTSFVVIIHPPRTSRVTPALVAGVTNQHVRDTTAYTPITIPEGVDPAHPQVVAQEESATRNIGGPTIGGNVSIDVTPRLSIVPDVRYNYGSIGDEINNALWASVRVIWRF